MSEHLTRQAPHRSTSSLWWLALVAIVAATLCAPFVRTVYWMGDEGILLNAAESMLRGSRLYVDLFEYLPPGGFVLTAAWLSIVGTSLESARLLTILTIVGIACFTYSSCRQASKDAPLSAILAGGWVVMSQGVWTQLNHHWLTTLFSMIAAWATLASVEHPQRRLRWPLIAGVAAGMAGMVTPHRGALAVLAGGTAFLNLRRYRVELICYGLACGLMPAILVIYLAGQHSLAAAFDDVIVFTLRRYSSIQSVGFGAFADLQNLALTALFPVAALLILLVLARDWRSGLRDRLLRVCAGFGVAGFAGCFPRPDITHIAFAAPLAGPLLAVCATRLTQPWRPAYRYIGGALAIVLCAPSALFLLLLSRQALRAEIVPTPGGNVAFLDQPGIRQLLGQIAKTPKGDAYFFYPYMPMLPFLTDRAQVSKYDLFVPGYTMPSQYRNACVSAVQHASWVVIDRRWTDPKLLRKIFPAMQDAKPQETKAFEKALDLSFEFVAQEGSFEMRRRREGIKEDVCSKITQ